MIIPTKKVLAVYHPSGLGNRITLAPTARNSPATMNRAASSMVTPSAPALGNESGDIQPRSEQARSAGTERTHAG